MRDAKEQKDKGASELWKMREASVAREAPLNQIVKRDKSTDI